MRILGYRKFIELRQSYSFGSQEMDQYEIIYDDNGKLMMCRLINEYGDCGSGRTSATWGYKEISEIENIGTLHFIPTQLIEVDNIEEFIDVDQDGGDNYYPSGYAKIADKYILLFKQTIRSKDTRQVYIFTGPSGIGKSYIAHNTNMSIFETDMFEEFPDEIVENIIVIGNKYEHTIDEVKKFIPKNTDIIVVSFNYLRDNSGV